MPTFRKCLHIQWEVKQFQQQRTESVVRVSKKSSVSSVLRKVGDLSSRGHKIRIPFPRAARQHLAWALGGDHPLQAMPSPRGKGLHTETPCREALVVWTPSRRRHLSPSSSDFGAEHAALPRLFPLFTRADSRQWLGTSPASSHPRVVQGQPKHQP